MNAIEPVRRAHYADYPACLPRYKWLVEEALRGEPAKMFNFVTIMDAHVCKVCGAAYKRKDFAGHVNEHAEQLRLGKKLVGRAPTESNASVLKPMQAKVKDDSEIVLTIKETLKEHGDPLKFANNHGLVAKWLANEIVLFTEDGAAGDPPLCKDCEV